MIFVDAHCDTISKIMETGENLRKNRCHIDLDRLMAREGGNLQFFAAFIDPSYGQAYAMKRAIQIIDRFYLELESNHDVMMMCLNYYDVQNAINSRKIAAILSIEGGDALQGDLAAARMFYKLGVRAIGLTWNHRNEIADGASEEITGGGLTSFGRSLIEEMNRLGMLVDLSHISERGFWDVLEVTKDPIIVSHSNAKKICDHRRNLSDRQIEAVKTNGGVIGINLYPHFLNSSGSASLKDIILHIEHIVSISGDEHLGVGADFDGIECTPNDIQGVEEIYTVFDELLRLNYSEESVSRLAGENFLRVIENVLK
ncbi:MAG: dipeptidase [Clostridia bacterium]|nr:dipeptidase [Clostridia bacterium]